MKEFWGNLKFAWQYTKDFKKQLILYLICNALIIAVSIALPMISARIIIYLTDSMFYQLLGMTIVYTILQILFNFMQTFSSKFLITLGPAIKTFKILTPLFWSLLNSIYFSHYNHFLILCILRLM